MTPTITKLRTIASVVIVSLFVAGTVYSQAPTVVTTGVADATAVIHFSKLAEYENTHPVKPAQREIKNKIGEDDMPERNYVPADAPFIHDKTPFYNTTPVTMEIPDSPPPAINFAGIPDNGNSIPPDVHGAAGPNHVMETLNSQVRIYTKTGTQVSSVSLNSFWSSLSVSGTFDPKICYDPYANRWIITALSGSSSNSNLLMGVSLSSDPTSTWKLYKFKVDANGTNWLDYPSMGFNNKWIAVQGNLFGVSSGSYAGSQLYVFDKANMYASGTGTYKLFTGSLFSAVPAFTYSSTQDTLFVLETWSTSAGQIRLYAITGAVGSELFSTVATISTGSGWSNGAGNFVPQLGGTGLINSGDSRMQSVVYRNGTVWGTHTIFLPVSSPNHAAAQWFQLSTTGTVVQKGRIEDISGSENYFYPSITVNAAGDALIGYCRSSSKINAAASYSLRMANDPTGIFRNLYTFKNGEAYYYKDFGSGRNRWGDYTAVCMDPSNDSSMWVLGQYAKSPSSTWGTWIAKVNPANGNQQWVDFSADSLILCANKPVQFTDMTNFPVTSWYWTFEGGVPATSTLQNPVVSFTGATSHSVTLVVNGGADSAVKAGYVTTLLAPFPNIIVSGDTNLCMGDSVQLSSVNVPQYLWNTGATTRRIYVSTPGTYYCIATGSNGCSTTSWEVTVTVKPKPVVTLAALDSVCNDDTPFPLTGGSPPGGVYTGAGVSGGIFDPYTAGGGTFPITYTYTDTNNCKSSAVQDITVNVCSGIRSRGEAIRGVTLIPNPNAGKFALSFHETLANATLRIFNYLGEEVHSSAINGNRQECALPAHTPAGIYLVQVSEGERMWTGKVVVEK